MPKDLEKLQGTWYVTSLTVDGRKMPEETFDGSQIAITGNTFTSVGMGAAYEGTVELDQNRTPKTFDLVFTAGHAAGTRNLGIFKLDGKRWTICLATRGDTRPKTFAAGPGTGFALETLERVVLTRKPAKRTARPKTVADSTAQPAQVEGAAVSWATTELEGEWAMVAGVFNGAAMSEEMVKWCRRVTRGDVTSVMAGPQVMLKARFTVDTSVMPRRIDYVNLEGANKGRSQAGIVELRDGKLSICMSAPQRSRPADFSSTPGDGRSYTTWRLLKM